MEAFLVSTMVVGLAEIGDKTQILSLMLAARLQRPLPIIFGIFFAITVALMLGLLVVKDQRSADAGLGCDEAHVPYQPPRRVGRGVQVRQHDRSEGRPAP
jgi:hypothetical protein